MRYAARSFAPTCSSNQLTTTVMGGVTVSSRGALKGKCLPSAVESHRGVQFAGTSRFSSSVQLRTTVIGGGLAASLTV